MPRSSPPIALLAVLGGIVLLGLALRLAYAGLDPTPHRFEDERYSFRNVDSLLRDGTLRPVSSYYPSPVFNAPVAGLIALSDRLRDAPTTAGADEEVLPRRHRKYLLARRLQAVYGALGIVLLFLIGRRLAGPVEGLLAATGLTFLPWHIHASGYFKPDALLVTSILLALWAELRALERPTWRRHVVVGLAIALAMSAKLTGGVVAIPFALVTFALARDEPRRLAGLALAGVTSAASFVLLNPYWTHYLTFLRGLQRDYAMRAVRGGADRFDVLRRLGELIVDENVHGLGFGLLALVGLGGFVVAARRADGGRAARARYALLALFPLLYTGFYVATTPYFKPNNFLPVLPVTTLAGVVVAVAAWRRLEPRLAGRLRVGTRAVAVALLAAVLVVPGCLYALRSLRPATWDAAFWHLDQSLRPEYARVVLVEPVPLPSPRWEGRPRRYKSWIALRATDDLGSLPRERLELADATLVTAKTLRGETGTPLRDLFDSADPAARKRFAPSGLEFHGTELLLLVHPWRRIGEPVGLEPDRCDRSAGRCVTVTIPGLPDGDAIGSLAIWARFVRGGARRLEARLDGTALELVRASAQGSEARFVSVRDRRLRPGARVVLRATPDSGGLRQVGIELLRWEPGVR